MPYAELHALSNFSFLRGASHPDVLLRRAQELGYHSLALTDRDGLHGAVRFWLASRRMGEEGGAQPQPPPRPIFGAELGLPDGSRVVALVRDREGWRNLSSLISQGRMACEKGSSVLPFERLVEHRAGLIFLSGGRFGPIDRILLGADGTRASQNHRPSGPWGLELGTLSESDGSAGSSAVSHAMAALRRTEKERARRRDDAAVRSRAGLLELARWRDAFGDAFFVEVQHHDLPEDDWLAALLGRWSDDLGVRRVATGFVHYARPEDRPLQDVLTCIRLHTTLDEAGTRLLPGDSFVLQPVAEVERRFAGDRAAVARTVEVAGACRFDLADLPYTFPEAPVPPGHDATSWLRELTWEGAEGRYQDRLHTDARIRVQIHHELGVIERLGLAGYFLIVWDIVRECRARGILCQGRGSAANSCVCFCLGITAVDPIRLDLLFERFLSEARGGWPDIDVDVSNSHREEILQYIYLRYGRTYAAMVANVIVYHPRSAIRDVGKAFGLGLDQVDRLAKATDHYQNPEQLMEVFGPEGENLVTDDGRILRQVLEMTQKICGFPRHLGIHSGGVVISGTPIVESCPVEAASMTDRTVLQWDKDDVAHTGLVKIDVLALGMLSVIQECTVLLRGHGVHFEMAGLTYDDPLVYDMICQADTVGLFQIESRAQMNTLPRLRPRCFYDLVVEVALIRPGPIQGDMVHPYIRRRQGKEAVTYSHPSLRPILERTLGIPLFQEQAMKMAIVAAGFSPAEADRLRKVMGFKRASDEMEALFEKMVEGMRRNGFDEKTARDVRNQLRGFAAYGFPESHAASFALIVYASAHLKCHQPGAFFAAMLNCQPMGFYSPASLIQDAKRRGVQVLPVCVQTSAARWTVPELRAIRAGLMQVEGLGEAPARVIEAERGRGGDYRSVEDFCDRAAADEGRGRSGLDRGHMEHLALSGALSCFGPDRRQALWAVQGWRRKLPLEGPMGRGIQMPLFPRLSPAEQNLLDHRTTGFSGEGHPLMHLRDDLRVRAFLGSADLRGLPAGSRVSVAGIVMTRQRPQTAKGTLFITLEDEGGFINVVVWADTFERHRRLLRQVRFLAAWGRIDTQDGVIHLIADRFADLTRQEWARLGTRPREGIEHLPSRDFH